MKFKLEMAGTIVQFKRDLFSREKNQEKGFKIQSEIYLFIEIELSILCDNPYHYEK